MPFDPTTAEPFEPALSQPTGRGIPSRRTSGAFDPSSAIEDEGANQGVMGTLKEGAKSAGRAIGATVDTYMGNEQAVVENAQLQQEAPKAQELQDFYADVQTNKADDPEDAGLWEGVKNVGSAVIDNPKGAGLAVVEQLPNAAPALAGGWAGMKGGAAAGGAIGTVVPGVGNAAGAVVGGIAGGLAGMFLGNAAIETGHKAMAAADDGSFGADEQAQVQREGAVKAAVITGVDALTLGLGGKVAASMHRTGTAAVEAATRKVLLDNGIDVANEAAVLAARSNPEISAAVRAAQESAVKVTDTFKRRATEAGTLMGMETVGEGLGEYLGELAATGKADVTDAVLEAAMSLGQSGVEAAWNMSRARDNRNLWKPADQVQPQATPENPAPAPVPRPDPNAGPLSAAAGLLPAPESNGTLYGDQAGNLSGNRPAWVNPENDPSRQSYGPGMDRPGPLGSAAQQAPTVIEGELLQAQPPAQSALPDLRQDGVVVDAEGNAQPGKLPNTPPANYVQGGRGMDQQAPVGARFANPLAARNAISKAAQPDTLEVVQVGPKEFEVQAKAPVLQNRDRSTPASITQMREIAANPDYSRLGFSRDFANGAPVVEPGANVPAQNLGRRDVATTASGRRIPVQYAVVEAGSLMPSHDVNGSADQQYATGMKGKSRAIAGNGRVAGLRQAFAQGTAGEYVELMTGDANLHGISPAAIRSMKEPVLVRIMPREEITQDIGDESNTTGVSDLNGTEEALNDARRINIDDMEFGENGEISETTVRQFIQSMPKSAQNGMLNGTRPSRKAYDRAENAIFATAYENEALIDLQAQAVDSEARTVMAGLLMAAPKMARLKGTGAWDIRGLVVEAAEAAINARRNGQTLEQYAEQIDLDRNPESQFFIELFANNIRSAKRIGDELSAVAELFYAEASKAETDMFGGVPRRSRQELLNGAANADTDRTPADAQAAGNQAGPGAAAPSSETRGTEPAEPAGAGAAAQPDAQGQVTPAEFDLTSYSEEELAAQSKAKAEADAKAAAEAKAAADKAQADRDRNDFTLTGSDRPADVATARGQNDMFAPPTRGEKKAAAEESTAPEHLTVGVDDRELAEIVEEFNQAQQSMVEDGERIHRLFDAPQKKEVVRLADKAKVYHAQHGWMTVAEAKAKIAEWKQHAIAQGDERTNADKVVLSLFDKSGAWSRPWEEAGYQVYRFDIQDDPEVGDVNNFSTDFFGDWFGDFEGNDIYAILAACPCTDFAVSGARHFAAKDADGRTVASVNLVHQTLRTIEYFRPAVWAVENPVGRIEKLGGLPPWRLAFDPNHLGDPYTKKTLIWGRFNGDLPVAPVEPTEGSKMHSKYGGKSLATKNARSVTPEGFAYGFFMANNAIDHPAMAISNKYDRLDRGLIEQAVKLGMTDDDISSLVDDFYYMDLDDEGANNALREAIAERDTGTKDRQPIRFTADQSASDYLVVGSIIEDGQGQQYRVHYQRNDLVVAHPIIDGKAQVNADSSVRFHIGRPESADGRRTDPIYLVQDRRQQALDDAPDGWRENLMKARQYANQIGVPHKGKTLEQLVTEIDGYQQAGEGGKAQGVADQLASMNIDELSALIDEISEQEAAPQTSKPKAKRSNKGKTASGKPRVRATTSKAERTDTAKPDEVSRAAGEIAKSLGVNMSSAGMNALEGLTQLFGGPGRLNSGLSFDEETYAKAKPFFAAAMRDIEAAGKDLRDFIRALLTQFGDGVKPYILRYAQDIKQEQSSVYPDQRMGADRPADAEQGAGGDAGGADAGAVGSAAGDMGQGEGGQQRPDAAAGLSGRGAAAGGERGNQSLDGTQSAVEGRDAGSADGGRGSPSSTGGLFAGRDTDAAADRAIESAVTPAKANVLPSSKPGTAAEIKAQMPFLTDGQAEDVAFAERRLFKPNGFGVLHTNGTGTGKTFSGLGTAARAHANGKTSILIVAPKQTIVDAWVKAGEKFFGLQIKVLESTKDNGGSGIVATTYANLGANPSLALREWDLVIADEAHYLSSAEDGATTSALENLRALTKRRGYARDLVRLRESEKVARVAELNKTIPQRDKEISDGGGNASVDMRELARDKRELDALNAELNALYEKEEAAFKALKPEDKPRGVFLSATPFAYEKNVQWAQEFLFDWGTDDGSSQAYNAGGPFERFMIQHFGYRMRYNKLTEPDAKVDRGLMQRAFNTWLKSEGALSGRALDSAFDYDRLFVTLESPIGRRVDEALKWLWNHSSGRDINGNELDMSDELKAAYRDLNDKITKENFNYHARMYFLEAIKSREALPHIRAHLALGRKVLVMHDFKQGGAVNPFILSAPADDPHMKEAIDAFSYQFSDLQRAFSYLPSPIQQLTKAFPDALVYNGNFSAKQRLAMQNAFNDDSADAPQVIIAQGDAMREGVSIHDTSGKHSRVLLHLGMPVKPTASIQQEGRIYRTGQASHAMFRYFTIGTAWERSAFAEKIAKRAGAAENLAMGEIARGLKQAFIDAYENADLYEPGFEGEGQGGKESDAALAAMLTPWDSAKSFYFGTKTQGKGRSSRGREGNDYFATPEPVGLKMVEWADIRTGESVLEPSAGHGAIARWFPDGAKVRVIEQSAELASRVALHVDGDVVHGSFEDHHIVNKYDAIVMNPPYGLGGAVAIPHLAKAADHLRDGGRVVALIPTGPAADKKFDNWLYALDKNGNSQHPDLHLIADVKMPAVTFERAGTSAATRLVIIEKVGAEQAGQIGSTRRIDLTSIDKIGELFDRMESMEMPARLKPVEDETEQTAPAKSVKPAKLSYAEQAAAQVEKLVTSAPIIVHTTAKGKELKGVIVTDMSLEEVREKLDKYAFRKDGGVFVRQEYIQRPEAGADTRMRINPGKAKGLPLFSAKGIAKKLQGSMGLRIEAVASEDQLPQEARAQIQRDGVSGRVAGIYHNGTSYLIASNLHDTKHAISTVLHEAVGHAGVKAVLGEQIGQVMRSIYRDMPKAMRAELERRYAGQLASMSTEARQELVAEEYVAHLAEHDPRNGLLDRIVALVKQFIRRVFGQDASARWTRADVVQLLAEAKKAAAGRGPNGGGSRYRYGAAVDDGPAMPEVGEASEAEFVASLEGSGAERAFASAIYKARGTESPFFQRWFRNSRMVSKEGKPMTFVHRSFGEKDRFDDNRLGGKTGTATAALGHYLARTDVGNVERYGPVIERFYIRMEKPKVVTQDQFEAMGDWSLQQVKAYRKTLMEQGFDGLYITGLAWPVVFEGKNIKAVRNVGTFDDSANTRYSLNSDAATREALRKMGLGGQGEAGLIEQVSNLTWGDLKAKIGSMATRAEEGLFDGLIGIKRAEEAVGVNDPNQQGYVSARLATGLADVMHAVLHYGAPEWREGMIQRRDGTRGVLEILADLGQDNLQGWLAWLGGKRGQMLKAEGRENNLTDADIAELLAMGRGKEELFERVYREYAAVNEAVLDLAQGAGLIDPQAREKWATEYYVPFYRQSEAEGIFTGPRTKRGLSHQTAAIKKLKGGDIPTNDLLVNILSGWTKRIDASMKNKALLETVDNLKGSEYLADEGMRWTRLVVPRAEVAKKIKGDRVWLEFWAEQLGMDETANHLQVAHELNKLDDKGYEELWGRVAPTDPDIIRVQRGGKNEFYRVKDDSLLRGLKFIEGSTFNDPITRIGRTFKRMLTTGVTASPDFILRNFIRDAAHAWTINKDGFTFGIDSIKGMRKAFAEDEAYRDLMFGGASFQGGYIHGTDPEASADIIRRALAKKGLNRSQQDSYLGSLVDTPAKAGAMLRTAWEKYREVGDKVENANRLSTYTAALDAGKSKRQAAFEAKDLMDFSMRGNFAAAQWFTDVVPFLNARAQGLYKLGRAMKGDKTLIAKEVAMKGGYLALFSLLLAAANGDDDRYKQLADWDKDANWHLWFSEDQEQPFRIPKPFELGLIFGTLPERLLHAATGNQDSGDLGKAVVHGVFQTLAFNPVPQFYQPIREVQANRNFFFDMPIEDMSDEGKLPEARYDERTSALSRGLGQITGPTIGVSPKQLDHLVRGYTGTLGGYVLSMSNLIAGIGSDAARPAATAGDIPLVKVLYAGDAVKSTQYQTDFYDMLQEVEQLHRTVRSYAKEGKVDEARALFEENRDKLRHRPALGFARQQLGNVRKQMDAVYRDTAMSAEAKREKLNTLQARANTIARRVSEQAGKDF